MAEKKRLGDILIDDGIISPDQLTIALFEQKKTGERLGNVLVTLGFVSDQIVQETLSKSLGHHYVDLTNITPDYDCLEILPHAVAKQHRVFPIDWDATNETLTVATNDALDIMSLDRIKNELHRNLNIKPVMASEVDIDNAIDRFYGYNLSIDSILNEIETGEIDNDGLGNQDDQYSHPIVRLVDALLTDAVKREASDIHLEPENGFLRIRYRIDGVLRQIRAIHIKYWPAIAVRIKIMSGLNIAETRAPQDGRISTLLRAQPIDFRIACQPTIFGENIVLRILDRKKGIVPLNALGLTEESRVALSLMMARPEGIILVSGPTGSGKTTTLYSMVNEINRDTINIMTLEDPVEYPMGGVRQTSINAAVKLDYASGVRSIMRQDPDVILIGEVRDRETASMAFRAAMTGHQVLSTIHTNSAISTISRLTELGVKHEVISGNVIGLIGQRLLRKLCEHCKETYEPDEIEKRLLGVDGHTSLNIYRATGCAICHNQGYRGRISIMEVLRFDQKIDALIASKASTWEIVEHAKKDGFKILSEVGSTRVIDGTTSLDELTRVIDLTSRLH